MLEAAAEAAVQVLNGCGIMVQLVCPSSCGTDEVLICSDPR